MDNICNLLNKRGFFKLFRSTALLAGFPASLSGVIIILTNVAYLDKFTQKQNSLNQTPAFAYDSTTQAPMNHFAHKYSAKENELVVGRGRGMAVSGDSSEFQRN